MTDEEIRVRVKIWTDYAAKYDDVMPATVGVGFSRLADLIEQLIAERTTADQARKEGYVQGSDDAWRAISGRVETGS